MATYRMVERIGRNVTEPMVVVRIEQKGWLFWHTVAVFYSVEQAKGAWATLQKFGGLSRVFETRELP